ncbi:prevent-host-death protein [Brevibacterium sp. 'Marine']|uniref:prevent-host-death protein n=1 Tax=Brevibacterium sp. 'Marine' TaxID=2725563 RepID=UPI00145FCA0D|nr:prevent-host-death protein [Brevibacterium sp. 'Marine']
MTTEARNSYKSSELSRGSAEVFAAASDHPVVVTRRDAEPLVLMSERENRARNQLLEIAAQLIGVATRNDEVLTDFMTDQFPWMLALSEADRHECASEVLDAARASFSVGQAHLAASTLTSWRETAEALAAGLGSEPVDWLDNGAAVPRP